MECFARHASDYLLLGIKKQSTEFDAALMVCSI